jgi:hypothetical protein
MQWGLLCIPRGCVMDVRFKTPANFFICGQTQSGKSYLTRRILQNMGELFDPVPTKIIYCYGEYQKKFGELSPSVEMIEGFPDDIGSLTRGHENSLIVLDDSMSQCSSDQRAVDLFTRGSHHMGVSVLYLTQNLFPPGKLSRTISLNSHYMLIFRNPGTMGPGLIRRVNVRSACGICAEPEKRGVHCGVFYKIFIKSIFLLN